MLWLPRGINAYITTVSAEKNAPMGNLLIEIVSMWAWCHGFRCDHPLTYREFLHRETQPNGKELRIFKCKFCGMLFSEEILGNRSTATPQLIGYRIVNYDEKQVLLTLAEAMKHGKTA